jgi:site-specific recombinase XerD
MTSGDTPRTAVALPQDDRELSDAAIEALAASIPDSTRLAYKADLKAFALWCAETEHSGLPTTTNTLTEYATHLAYTKHLSPSTIERARWAIRRAHRVAGHPVPDSDGLADVVKGYKAHLAVTKDPKARPQKATAADKATLAAMTARLDLSTPAGCRDAALILLGFAVAARRSELSALDIGDVTVEAEGIVVSVYRIKTRKLHDVAVPYAQDASLCPVLAVLRWISALERFGRTSGPLFVRINQHGQLVTTLKRNGAAIGDATGRMKPQAIGQVVGRKARAAALPGKHTAHSLRRGMATEARRAGHDRITIARAGGWNDDSRVLSGYMEDADRWDDNALKGVL